MPLTLPSLSKVEREIHKSFIGILEECFQFDQLLDHLNTHSAAKIACLLEVTSRVVFQIE